MLLDRSVAVAEDEPQTPESETSSAGSDDTEVDTGKLTIWRSRNYGPNNIYFYFLSEKSPKSL